MNDKDKKPCDCDGKCKHTGRILSEEEYRRLIWEQKNRKEKQK